MKSGAERSLLKHEYIFLSMSDVISWPFVCDMCTNKMRQFNSAEKMNMLEVELEHWAVSGLNF